MKLESDAKGNAKKWTAILQSYRTVNDARSVIEILITAIPFILLWVLMWASLSLTYWLSLLIAIPTAGFLVRLFMIQHDCGHGAFFRSRRANDWVGRVLGVITLTPYDHWRASHAVHHAPSGNLEHRGIGDIDTLTVREYVEIVLVASLSLPSLPQPLGDVRHRPSIPSPAQEQVPDRWSRSPMDG